MTGLASAGEGCRSFAPPPEGRGEPPCVGGGSTRKSGIAWNVTGTTGSGFTGSRDTRQAGETHARATIATWNATDASGSQPMRATGRPSRTICTSMIGTLRPDSGILVGAAAGRPPACGDPQRRRVRRPASRWNSPRSA